MDAKLFRLPTQPNFFAEIGRADPFDANQRQKFSQLPAQSIRFPGYAAPMSDGRLVTDYAAHCESNIPAGRQFPTKHWMQNHAPEIIEISRRVSARRTGAVYAFDPNVVPPPATKVICKPDSCQRIATYAAGGIGLEREGADAPELFGTYSPITGAPALPAHTPLTSRYEGGRNSLRGRVGPALG
jgi:hypothetical protein